MDDRQDNKPPLIPESSFEDMRKKATKPYAVAILPCKIGSTRLPNKNFLEVDGYPMMMWSLMKAVCCPHIDLICISTDNTELLQEKVPNIGASMFDDVILLQREAVNMHPETPIFNLVVAALTTLAAKDALKRPPTHVVMMQPNVPTIPQEVINELVAAVVTGPYNVSRHFSVNLDCFDKEWVSGVMTGGCDAYKISALTSPVHMDSYNYAVITADPEVHDQEGLDRVNSIIEERKKGDE